MDEQNNLPLNEENMQSVEVEESAVQSVEENPAPQQEQAAPRQSPAPFNGYGYPQPPFPGQPNYWQGGYSYQNPNPYQNYQAPIPPKEPVKKERNRPFVIAAIVAAGIMVLCCAVIFGASLGGIKDVLQMPSGEGIYNTPADEEEKDVQEETADEPAKRDEDVVYNTPEITTKKEKGEELSLVDINKKVKDSVVGILVGIAEEEEMVFSGSGFIVSEDGYIITNEHVISGATRVEVVLSDGITEYQAVIVGKDSQSDLAILKVEAKGLSAAELGDSDALEVGERVVAIGNPYGMVLAGSMTDGIVSALNRKIKSNGSFMTLIQTDASINPGNSGGPLVNAYGQIVGICSSKLVATDYEGIGFAIPINNVIDITDELITYGYVKTRGYIGIGGSDLSEEYCKYHNIPQGVYVSYVDPECDAAKKGMKVGDIIIGFNGEEITSMAQLNETKNEFRPGDTVKVKVWRDKKEIEFKIKLTESSE